MVLDKALHHLADEFAFAARGIQFQLDYQLPTPPHDDVVIFTLYRLVQELLNNINKHASATQITVRLSQQDDLITLDVIDNGVGIAQKGSTHSTGSGFGLRGIEERVQALGGNWLVKAAVSGEPTTPRGTHIIVNLPTKFKQKDD
ncbi:ATP-binding protein [Pectobacterium atrosepticum]